MKAIFIADAHLRHPEDANYRRLLDLLDQQQGRLDGLFLLGDIFEFWIGYNHVVFSEHLPLLARLQQLAEDGCRLFFVEGNHDFNMGAFFSKTLNCTLIPDHKIVDWDGRSIFICHGDLANPEARGYRLLRAFWRSRFLTVLSRIVHPDATWRFGNFLCDLSRKKERYHRDPSAILLPYARRSLEQGADSFVCGHFHYPLQTDIDGRPVTVLGDWITDFSYLVLEDGDFRLESFQSPAVESISASG